jgi:transmembrane sensor
MSTSTSQPRATSGNPAREASLWIARLERGLHETEGPTFREWLKVRANRDAILEIASLWHGQDVNAVLKALIPSKPAFAMAAPKKAPVSVSQTALAVCVLAFCVVFLLGHLFHSSDEGGGAETAGNNFYVTAIGEKRQIELPDGTTITLNTGTRLSVEYTASLREVSLRRGEATFNVKAAIDRPFSVNAGRRRFLAGGTQFNLRTVTPENVELIVMDGTVKVMDAPPSEPRTPARRRDIITYGQATISAFQEALVEPGFQSISHIEASEMNARLAWQRGFIICEDKALPDMLAEVERYTPTRFVVADDSLRNVRISGSFRTGNVNAVRRALRQDFLVKSQRDDQGRILLTALDTR